MLNAVVGGLDIRLPQAAGEPMVPERTTVEASAPDNRPWTRRSMVDLNAVFFSSLTAEGGHVPGRLQPVPHAEEFLTGHVIAEAGLNGFTAEQVISWQPDYAVHHDGKYVVLKLKGVSGPKRGPEAGGAMTPHRPPGDTCPPQREGPGANSAGWPAHPHRGRRALRRRGTAPRDVTP
ncbi:hypothetical protein [Streptomyces siamensis]|uniref:Uncharacterized protein n=1 Tax=Streptomyces siamensis TaxID=1274986 RepID=A0ABP9J9P8_9ACTN